MTERWLTDEDGSVRLDVAASLMLGEYSRGVVVCYRQLRLSPTRDRVPEYSVHTADGHEVNVLNAGAVRTGSELVDVLDQMHERTAVGSV